MKKTQRLKYALAAPIFVVASVALQFANVTPTYAATLTWTGAGDASTFADGANWNTGTAPVDGDVINFAPLISGQDWQDVELENDLVGVELAGLTYADSNTGFSTNYTLDTITFQNNATISKNGVGGSVYSYLRMETGGTVNGLGNISIGTGAYLQGVYDVVGNIVAATNGAAYIEDGSIIDGNLVVAGNASIGDVEVGGDLVLQTGNTGLRVSGPGRTISNDFVVHSFDNSRVLNQLAFGSCATPPGGGSGGGGAYPVTVSCGTYGTATFNLTGNITLNSDLVIHVAQGSTVNVNGNVTANGHTITMQATSMGTLNVGGSNVIVPETTTTFSGDQANTDESVTNKETATLEGVRAYIQVQNGGTLKGTGTASGMWVADGAKIAPGNSPGKLTVLTNYTQAGTYVAEILNSTSYDQLVIGQDYVGTSGSPIYLQSTAKLEVSLFDGWSIKKDDKFTVIDNRSQRPVDGTFQGLAEGTQFTVGEAVFSISYVGGDGNDVVLTAINSVSAPNTGVFQAVKSNPALVAVLGVVSAATVLGLALRRKTNR